MGELLDKAIVFAVESHKVRTRMGSMLPFIVHPLEAIAIASYMTDREEILAAAALHDVVEKEGISYVALEQNFGKRIADLATYFSSKTDNNTVTDWKTSKEQDIQWLFCAEKDQKMIFLADRLSNMRSIRRKFEIYREEVFADFHMKDFALNKWYYQATLKGLYELRDEYAYREYKRLIEEVFGSAEMESQ